MIYICLLPTEVRMVLLVERSIRELLVWGELVIILPHLLILSEPALMVDYLWKTLFRCSNVVLARHC
jgi:hypothetical protein